METLRFSARVYEEMEDKPLWLAVALLLLILGGIIPSRRYLKRKAQILCVVSCILIALVLAVCIDLTISFVDAVQNQRLHCEVIF